MSGPYLSWGGDPRIESSRQRVSSMTAKFMESLQRRIAFAETPEVHEAIRVAAETVEARDAGDKEETQKKFDQLLKTLLVNFGKPDDQEVGYAIPRARREVEMPQPVKQSTVPLAIVSELLTVYGVRLNTKKVTHWKDFVDRCGRSVLGC
jgi:hypothetical protein